MADIDGRESNVTRAVDLLWGGQLFALVSDYLSLKQQLLRISGCDGARRRQVTLV